MIITPGQQDQIGELNDQWSFFWDKRRSLWLAAEDCPDGEQMEDADLDVLLAGCRYSLQRAANNSDDPRNHLILGRAGRGAVVTRHGGDPPPACAIGRRYQRPGYSASAPRRAA